MNIIFGDSVNLLPPGAIVLELDTMRGSNNQRIKTYCLVQILPESEYQNLDHNTQCHSSLLNHYRQRNWIACRQLIQQLHGQWNCELDSFYDILLERITDYEQLELPEDWDGSMPIAQ